MRLTPSAILAAAYRFEQLSGKKPSLEEADATIDHGLSDTSAKDLTAALIRYISEAHSDRASAYWALGKAYNHDLLPFFITQLQKEIFDDSDSLFQIMIALDNLEEPVFSPLREGSYSAAQDAQNVADAKSYLKRKTEQGAAANP